MSVGKVDTVVEVDVDVTGQSHETRKVVARVRRLYTPVGIVDINAVAAEDVTGCAD